jgi:hypothetical protein
LGRRLLITPWRRRSRRRRSRRWVIHGERKAALEEFAIGILILRGQTKMNVDVMTKTGFFFRPDRY